MLALVVVGLWSVGVVSCDLLEDQPSCNVAVLPGPAEEVDDLIELTGTDTFGSEGELLLTTIVVDRTLTLREYLQDLLDPEAEVVPRDVYYPPGRSVEDAQLDNEIWMADSQLEAKIAALRHLGIDVGSLPAGAEIVVVDDDGPAAATALEPGDVILAVDDTPVGDADEAVDAVQAFAPGDEVTLELQRADGDDILDVTLGESPDDPGQPYLGVYLRDYQVLPLDIEIQPGAIIGPSAGLVFSLGIVDRLTDEDLTGGDVIAATGMITADGEVGPIGGIAQKIAGAVERDEPADVFLVPTGNWEEAITATPDRPITLIEVATLDEAVEALRTRAAGGELEGAVALG